jgi:hypothetical protein
MPELQGRYKDALVYRCVREHVEMRATTAKPPTKIPCALCNQDRARKMRFKKPDPGERFMILVGTRRVSSNAELSGAPAPSRLGPGFIEA